MSRFAIPVAILVAILVRGTGLILLTALLLLPTWGGPAAADDEKEETVVQVFHVGALTAGRREFVGEVAPPVGPDDVSDEERPLFGGEYEEPIYPVGMVDELIELVQSFVEPASWEAERAGIRSQGEGTLVVRNTPAVVAAVARYLADLERRMLQMATIEVRAVRVDPAKALEPAQPSAAGPSLTLSGFVGQRISAFSGSRHTYVQGYRVEVAQSATTSDPTIGVANLGLRVDARVLPGDDPRRLSVDLDVHFADMAAARKVGAGLDRTVDAPSFDVVAVRTMAEVTPGRWTRLSGHAGQSGWVFYARVSTVVPDMAVAAPLPIRVEGGRRAEMGTHMLDVRDLNALVPSVRRRVPDPLPSNFTPPEPCELFEPAPGFPADSLAELIMDTAPRGTWDDPAMISLRNGQLIVRTTPTTLASIKELLATLRRQTLWSVTTRVDVVELPTALLERVRGDGSGALVLAPDQRALLRGALSAGDARRTDRVELEGREGALNEIKAGRSMAYVSDYHVKIAQDADISGPIMGRLFSGLRVGVTPDMASGGKHVLLDVRFRHSHQPNELRRADTPAGPVELPDMDLFRVRCGLVVPLGGTVLLGAHGEGARRTVVLLTPELRKIR